MIIAKQNKIQNIKINRKINLTNNKLIIHNYKIYLINLILINNKINRSPPPNKFNTKSKN